MANALVVHPGVAANGIFRIDGEEESPIIGATVLELETARQAQREIADTVGVPSGALQLRQDLPEQCVSADFGVVDGYALLRGQRLRQVDGGRKGEVQEDGHCCLQLGRACPTSWSPG